MDKSRADYKGQWLKYVIVNNHKNHLPDTDNKSDDSEILARKRPCARRLMMM